MSIRERSLGGSGAAKKCADWTDVTSLLSTHHLGCFKGTFVCKGNTAVTEKFVFPCLFFLLAEGQRRSPRCSSTCKPPFWDQPCSRGREQVWEISPGHPPALAPRPDSVSAFWAYFLTWSSKFPAVKAGWHQCRAAAGATQQKWAFCGLLHAVTSTPFRLRADLPEIVPEASFLSVSGWCRPTAVTRSGNQNRIWPTAPPRNSSPEGACRWFVSGLPSCTLSKKNRSVGFSVVFKRSFLQKYSLGMPNLCL